MIIYLTSPYTSDHEEVRRRRYNNAKHATATLLELGLIAYSPIVHNVTIKPFINDGNTTHRFWLDYDMFLLRKCERLVVLMLEGWRESGGVQQEIEEATEMGIPIDYLASEHRHHFEKYAQQVKFNRLEADDEFVLNWVSHPIGSYGQAVNQCPNGQAISRHSWKRCACVHWSMADQNWLLHREGSSKRPFARIGLTKEDRKADDWFVLDEEKTNQYLDQIVRNPVDDYISPSEILP